jgi:WD40 repeat protein
MAVPVCGKPRHNSPVSSVAFGPNGKHVASGSYDGVALAWEADTGKEIARISHDSLVISLVFNPDAKYVISGGCNKTDKSGSCVQGIASLWEAATGKEVAYMTHDDFVRSVAFSPDGKYVVSGSYDGTARMWDAATGKEVARMIHDNAVTSVAFSPDGKYVVSGSYDGTARVWEATTGKEVARMTHDDNVISVVFSPDGKQVASGSSDNTARMWMWQVNDLIANACADLPRNLTRAEWQQYIGDALPYEAVCENLPIEPEETTATQ